MYWNKIRLTFVNISHHWYAMFECLCWKTKTKSTFSVIFKKFIHKFIQTLVSSLLLLYYIEWNFLFIRTYDELGSMGVDFGRLLENQEKTDEKSSRPPSTSVSRSNSRTASITSLSSLMTDTSKQEPNEVILTDSLTYFFKSNY